MIINALITLVVNQIIDLILIFNQRKKINNIVMYLESFIELLILQKIAQQVLVVVVNFKIRGNECQ